MRNWTRNSLTALLTATVLALGITDAFAAHRVVLGNAAQIPLAQNVDAHTVDTLKTLRGQAAMSGKVRVIVGVRAAFAPEGQMAAADVAQQRNEIAHMHATVLGKIPTLKTKPGKVKQFSTIPFMAIEVDPTELEALAGQAEITSIEEDRIAMPTLAESVPLIGGTTAWSMGYTGAGQAIAILDTGVDSTHPFLAGKVVSEACYSSNNAADGASSLCPGGVTQSTAAGSGLNCDTAITGCFHGTHVAGIAAGNGASAGVNFSGVAKDASLIAIKVFTRFDSVSSCGSTAPCIGAYTSDINLALERVYMLKDTYSIAAVNMSLGGGAYSDQASCDAYNASTKTAIDNLRSVNIATVIASGNNGLSSWVSSPGCISSAVSVGATDKQDVVTSYSNSASFLNLLAPGDSINSSVPGGTFAIYSGTSMATPHVAGSWALLKQQNPNIAVTDALNLLTGTGIPIYDAKSGFTTPRIRIDGALNVALNAPPTLTYSSEAGYGTDGVNPNSGSASTMFTYKAIYTDASNVAPSSIRVCIDGTCYAMSRDTGATDPALSDRSYSNGEQYVYTTTLAAGAHSYYFAASRGTATIALPASGALSGPNLSSLAISTSTLPDGNIGIAYNATLAASGGTPPYSWNAPGLPTGLSINSSTGVISGTPTQAGVFGFMATVSDATGTTFTKALSIYIVDLVAPTVPTGLTASAFSAQQVNLSWTASTDNVGVTAYKVYRNGVQIGAPAGTNFIDTGLTTATAYSYAVAACDAAGNCSTRSNAVSTTTLNAPAPGAVVAWGYDMAGDTAVPAAGLSGVVAVAGGWAHSVALKNDGTVVAWGANGFGQTSVPAGLSGVVAIAAGAYHTVALKSDGTVVAWGSNSDNGNTTNQATVPAGLSGVVAIAAGFYHTVALKNNGTLVAWGDNTYGQTTIPAGLSGVAAIAAGGDDTGVLKNDGTVLEWGDNSAAQTVVPPGLSFVAIAMGRAHTLALLNDGTVMAWGDNSYGQTYVPMDPIVEIRGVAIAGGYFQSLALKSNGTVVAWGHPSYGGTVPAGLSGVTAIAAGYFHSLAITTPDTLAPSVPTGLTTSVISTSQINLTWTASTDNVGVTGYKVYRNSVQVGTSAVTSFADSGLSAATTYSYTVAACDAAGNCSAQSTAVSATTQAPDTTPPSVPSGLTAITVNTTQINLSWTASTDNVGVTGYRVYRNGVQVGVPTSTGFSDTGLTASTTYSYTAAACDAAGNCSAQSSPSVLARTPLAAINPSDDASLYSSGGGYVVSNGGTLDIFGTHQGAVKFSTSSIFRAVTQARLAVNPYSLPLGSLSVDVYGFTSSSGLIDAASANAGTYLGTLNLPANLGYGQDAYFDVTTFVAANTSVPYVGFNLRITTGTGDSFSSIEENYGHPSQLWVTESAVPDANPPAVPTGLTVTDTSMAQISMSWAASTDDIGMAGYKVYRDGVQVGAPAGTSFIDTRLTSTTTYSYTVAACDREGNCSAQSTAFSATTVATPPTVPTGLAASAASATQINLTWMAATDNVGVTGYKVYRNGMQVGAPTGTLFIDSNLVATTTYSYTVSACDALGNCSAQSNLFSVTTSSAALASGFVMAWGDNTYGQTSMPAGLGGVTAIEAGDYHNVALKNDGTVAAWGQNYFGKATVPAGLVGVVAVSAGYDHTLALKSDGTVVGWGRNANGQITMPLGLSGVTAIAAGMYHSVALKNDGTVVAWGYNAYGETTVPADLSGVVAIAAIGYTSWALKNDGTVVSWGFSGRPTIPAGLSGVVAIAAGGGHCLALKYDGTVIAWGANNWGQATVPAGLSGVIAISAGAYHSVALKSDGTVVTWGSNAAGETTIPAGLTGVMAIATGYYDTMVLVKDNVAPTVPAGLTASAVSATQIHLTWGASTDNIGATAYKVYRGGTLLVTLGNLTSYSDSGLTAGTTYSYTVAACDAAGNCSAQSTAASATTYTLDTTPPSVPMGLTANPVRAASASQINLSWMASTDNVGVTGYKVYRNGVQVGTSAGASFIDTGLTAATAYSYTVASCDAAGNCSAQSASVSANTLAAVLPGTVTAWGWNGYGQTTVPAGLSGVTAIAPGNVHTVALQNDGTVVVWGGDGTFVTTVPAGLSGVTGIGAGWMHTAALKSDGTVVVWGDNSYNQMLVPAGLSGVVAIAAGNYHTIALKNDGTVVTWGGYKNGSSAYLDVPAGLSGVVAIAAGGAHSVALKSDGTVVAWGENAYGQAIVPAGLSGVVAIAAGTLHTLALKSDGTIVGWGLNNGGQTTVPAGLSGVIAISTGIDHTLALKNGTVMAWGWNGDGQTSVPAGLTGVTAIAAGRGFSVAISVPDTTAPTVPTGLIASPASATQINLSWTASTDNFGTTSYKVYRNGVQVGVAAGTSFSDTGLAGGTTYSYMLAACDAAGNCSAQSSAVSATTLSLDIAPPTVPTGLTASAVSTTQNYLSWTASTDNYSVTSYKVYRNGVQIGTSALTSFVDVRLAPAVTYSYTVAACDAAANCSAQSTAVSATTLNAASPGTVAAWGYNNYGQTTVPAGLSGVVAITAGGGEIGWGHSVALKSDGTVVAWGNNANGQTTVPAGLSGITAIAAGDAFTVVLKNDGTVAAWGVNSYGQTTVPAGLSSVVAIAAGGTHTVAVKNDGTVVAWGDNRFGQTMVPAGLSGVTTIAAGYRHIVAAKSDGTVVGWGDNTFGQISTPAGLSGVVALAAGTSHTVALKSDGTVVAWGDNAHGQTTVPSGLGGVVAIAAGHTYTLALKSDGTVVAWGSNTLGETSLPAGLNGVTAISAAYFHGLALRSGAASDVVAPSVPTGLTANAVSAIQINLSWTASTDNVGVTVYKVYRNGVQVGTSTGASFFDFGLTSAITYSYTVAACDAAGNCSAQSVAVSATTLDNVAPAIPTGLLFNQVSATQLSFSWAASTDNVGVTGYKVYRGGTLLATLGNVTSYTDTGLTAGTAYSYSIAACDAANNCSAPSAAASATTLPDNVAPAVPTGLTASAASATQINLAWTASTDNVGVTAYKVYRGGALIATLGNVTSYSNTGLTSSTTYSYTVVACDATGNCSAQSAAVSASTPQAFVDLIPTALSTTVSSVNIGGSLVVSNTVMNQGTTATSAATTVSYYLSTDATITTADTLIGSRSIASLAAGASSTASPSITIPTTFAPGVYYLGMIADSGNAQPESDETNNALAAVGTITVVRNVDLIPTALSTTLSSVNIGGSLVVSNTVMNQGTTATSAATTVSYYLSTDATITTADTLIGSRSIASLAAGASSAASPSITIPTTFAPGVYYLGMIADSGNAQPESDETNNALAAVGTITVVRNVDLIPTALSTTVSSVNIGGSLVVSNTVMNQGTTATSAATTVSYYLSTDATITTADTLIGSRSIASLAAGASSAASPSITIPTTFAPGVYYLGMIADSGNAQPESDETNNALAAVGTITVVRNVDLIPTALSTTVSSVNIGGSLVVSNTVMNQGTTATSAATTVSYYLSTDATITTADTLIGSRSIASLAAGASSTASPSITIPTTFAPGVYYLGMIADSGNAQPESDETNNALAAVGTITVVRNVDLIPTALSTTLSSVNIGGSLVVSNTVMNQGTTATSAATTVSYYLSTDATITTADTLIGSRSIASLAAGASSAASPSITIPTTFAPGVYYLGMIADSGNAQPESDETNNALAAVGTITVVRNVDLIPTALSTTVSSVNIGGSLVVSNTVMNQGTTATSAATTVSYYLSTDATITTADTLIGSRSIASLAAGASSAASPSITIPTTFAPGVYYLGMIADSGNAQPESDETNNALAAVGTITVVRNVDLIPTALSTTVSSVNIGGSLVVSNTVMNQGTTATSAATTVSYYLSTDATITTADTLIGSRSIASLAAGASSAASPSITIPTTFAPGVYYLGMIADSGNAQPESDETNNALAAVGTITVVRNVDLIPTALSTTVSSVNIGGSLVVSNTVMNQGTTATSAATTVSYYLSTDATITTADTLIGSRSIASLAAGASSTASPSITIPTTFAPGVYYLGMIADSGNAQPESDETNNALVGGIITLQ